MAKKSEDPLHLNNFLIGTQEKFKFDDVEKKVVRLSKHFFEIQAVELKNALVDLKTMRKLLEGTESITNIIFK